MKQKDEMIIERITDRFVEKTKKELQFSMLYDKTMKTDIKNFNPEIDNYYLKIILSEVFLKGYHLGLKGRK